MTITICEGRKGALAVARAERDEALDLLEEAERMTGDEVGCCWFCGGAQSVGQPHADDCKWLTLMRKAGRRE